MTDQMERLTYRVVLESVAKSEPMDIAEAHNYALELRKEAPVEVVETYEWFCKKCGDDYWTTDEEVYAETRTVSRWRCHACVMGML